MVFLNICNRDPFKVAKSSYSLSSSISRSTASTNTSQIFGENIKLETDSHCFFVREQSFGNGMEERSAPLFAQKYMVRVKFNSPDLKRLRMVWKSCKTIKNLLYKKDSRNGSRQFEQICGDMHWRANSFCALEMLPTWEFEGTEILA